MRKIFFLFSIILIGISCCLPSKSLYGNVYGRFWVGKIKLHGKVQEQNIDFQSGYAIGEAIGVSFLGFCRCEIEGIQLFDQFKNVKRKIRKDGVRGKLRDYTFLANVIFEGPTIYFLRPYLGIGGGYSREHLKIHTEGTSDKKDKETKKRFARQILGGLSISFKELLIYDISLFIEGRYFSFEKQHVKGKMLSGGISLSF